MNAQRRRNRTDVCELFTMIAIVLVALLLLWAELWPSPANPDLAWSAPHATVFGPTMVIQRAGPGPGRD